MCCSAVNDGSCSPWVMCSCSVVRGNQIRDSYHHEHQTNNVWKKKATDSAENLVLFYCVQMRDLHPDLGSSSKEIDFYCE